MHVQHSFLCTTLQFAWYQLFKLLFVGTLKIPSAFISILKWRHTSRTQFWCLSNHSQALRDLRKRATVLGQTCPRLFWLMRRIFSAVVYCDLTNNNKSRLLNSETFIVNLLRQLYVKYYINKVFIFEYILSCEPNSWNVFIRNYLYFNRKNSPLNCIQVFCVHPYYVGLKCRPLRQGNFNLS